MSAKVYYPDANMTLEELLELPVESKIRAGNNRANRYDYDLFLIEIDYYKDSIDTATVCNETTTF